MNKKKIFYIEKRTYNNSDDYYEEFESHDEMTKKYLSMELYQELLKDHEKIVYVAHGEKSVDLDKYSLIDDDFRLKLINLIREKGIKETTKYLSITRQFLWLLRFKRVHYIKNSLFNKIKEVIV